MQKLKKMLAMLLCVLMVIAVALPAYAQEANGSNEMLSEAGRLSLTAGDETVNLAIGTLTQELPTASLEVELKSYVGLTKQFFVMSQGRVSNDVILELRLVDSSGNVCEIWSIGANEYREWNIVAPEAGNWRLLVKAIGLGSEEVLTVYARWV